jgi:FlaA1/EpsC-like NDP-sugar epimerase
MIKDKTILIIGGTGALGKTLVKEYNKDNIVIVFSRNEQRQEEMKLDYPNILYRIGDVKNKDSIVRAINIYHPHIIINTAALKIVWGCQDNPFEAVQVNIVGHQNLIDAVQESNHKIETLIYTSTDKACKPVNVYGMTKAIAEQLYVDFSKKQKKVKVVIVRYGNVLNSTGSIIPLFKRMINNGYEYLPITDFKMTRFMITLNQAINLIEKVYYDPESNGKIAVPKIKSSKITDIAKILIKHSKNSNIKLKKAPIKDGEKLHEEMISEIEFQRTVECDTYYLIGSKNINESYDHKPFNSQFNLIPFKDVEKFLEQNEVFKF